jgi:hypothetical protein
MTLEELVDLGATMREAQIDRQGNSSAATRAAATVAEKLFDRAINRILAEAEVRKSEQPCVLPAPQKEVSLSVSDAVDLSGQTATKAPRRIREEPTGPPWAQ